MQCTLVRARTYYNRVLAITLGIPLLAAGADPAPLQRAIDRACDGVHPGLVVLDARTVTASLRVPSACTIRGARGWGTTIRGTIAVHDARDVRIEDLACDGGGDLAASCIEIARSQRITISNVLAEHALTGLAVLDGAADVTVEDSVFTRNGRPLPSSDGGGIGVSPGRAGIRSITLRANQVFGNNQGIAVFNSPVASVETTAITVLANHVYANANGISIDCANRTGGPVRGVAIVGNHVACNGWPARGAGLPGRCVPGALQRGGAASAAGVGIDVIGDRLSSVSIVDNFSHDNVFDGISTDGRTFASPASSTMAAVIVGNRVERNGVGDVGAGLWNDSADGNVYRSNVVRDNNLPGVQSAGDDRFQSSSAVRRSNVRR